MKNLYIADLHIHSRYSRATSRDCIPEMLEFTAARKGIGVLGSGDFTHPAWREELKEKLEKNEEGLYVLKKEYQKDTGRKERPKFIISGEISSIYKKNGKVRKVHSLILLPDLEAAQKLAFKLETIGNLHSDGRPILGLDCRDLVEITLSVCPDAIYIPAHIWTPHFSLFGAFSGFDTIEECYEDMTPYIHALETGLSSDPAMNWQLSALDPYFLISNSDAHSPAKLGREGNLLEGECSYLALKEALTTGKGLLGTIEFFPLIAHITFLLKNQNVLPEEITAVTFTNQAAKELKERLILSVGKELANRIQAGTFHSICMKLLKDSGKEFHLVQEAECIELAEHILNSFEHKKRVTAKQIVEQSSRKKMLLSYKNSLEDPFLLAYEKALNAENALDFDDLLLETLKCYETEEFPRDCFSYLLVDEVQDINLIQYRLLKTWNKNGKELFVIGDPDQAIYGFRGALSDCFKRIQQEMPETKTIRLTENYRSTPQILSLAECIISEKDKQKRGLHAVNQKGVSVRIVENQTSLSEGIFLAKEINRLVGGIDMLDFQTASTPNADSTSVGFSDICILYRTKRQAKQLEYCLQKEGIPYVVSGREEFLMELEVRATIDFFFSLFHPDDTLLSKNCREFLWGSSGEELYKKALEEWSNRIEEETPKQILDLWIKEREWDKKESIQKLIAMAGCYKTMQEFLTALIFGVESDLKRSGNSVYIPDAVHLMTLHGSKGLEFPVVFLCGVNQGLIPLQIGTDIDLEEERRLFYVGITRAKETLILSSHAELSEFLDPAFSDLSQSQITTEEKENTASLNFIEKEENHKKKKRDKKQEQSFGTQMNLFDFLDTGGQDAKKI